VLSFWDWYNVQEVNLKNLLTQAKDTSELMLDLAYAALLYSDEDVAEEVERFGNSLTSTVRDMQQVCMLAARSPDDAAGLVTFLRVTDAIAAVGRRAIDISRVVLDELGLPEGLRDELTGALEVTDRVQVAEQSRLDGQDVQTAEWDAQAAVLLAVHRGHEWMFDPEDTLVLLAGDTLLVRGDTASVGAVRSLAGASARVAAETPERQDCELSEVGRAFVEMKNLSEVAVALGYAVVLTGEPSVAAQVGRLTRDLGNRRRDIETWALGSGTGGPQRHDVSALRGLLHLAVAAESLGNAAQDMATTVQDKDQFVSVVAEALAESDDTIAVVEVVEDSSLAGNSLRAAGLGRSSGVTVLGVSGERGWDYRPQATRQLTPGDRLIVSGPHAAVKPLVTQ